MFNIFHVDDINSMKCINVVSRKSNEAVLLNWHVILVLIFVDPVYCTFNSNFESFAKANAVTTRLRKKLIFTKMEYLEFFKIILSFPFFVQHVRKKKYRENYIY